MPGSLLRGGFPQKVKTSDTIDLLGPTLHPSYGQGGVQGGQAPSGVEGTSFHQWP